MTFSNYKIDINFLTVVKIIAAGFFCFILYSIFNTLLIVFVSIILASSIKPLVKKAVHFKIPKTLATMAIVFGFLAFLVTALYLGIQPLIREIGGFVNNFPILLDNISKNYNVQIPDREKLADLARNYSGTLTGQVGNASGELINFGKSIMTIMLSTLGLLALTFYQIAEDDKVKNFIAGFFSKKDKVKNIIDRSEAKLGSWFRGQLSLMFFIGIFTYFVLFVIGQFDATILKFALPLAVIAGILEIVPVVGPTLALIPALIVGISISPVYFVVVLIAYIVIQQIESNIIIPRVMNKAVGIDPMIVIIGIMVGNSLMGALGSLLSVPIMAVLSVLYEEWKLTHQAGE
jgi:predicted PurR-regulated permease PerM